MKFILIFISGMVLFFILVNWVVKIDRNSTNKFYNDLYGAYHRNCDSNISFEDFKLLYNRSLLKCGVK
jgi:hypothetical protein